MAPRPVLATCLHGVATLLLAAGAALAGDRTSGVLGAGTPFETRWSAYRADEPGPTVVLTAGMHGNEPAGARAARQIAGWTVASGSLIVLPRCNEPALAAERRRIPGLDGDAGDLNRHFPPDAAEHAGEVEDDFVAAGLGHEPHAVRQVDGVGGQRRRVIFDIAGEADRGRAERFEAGGIVFALREAGVEGAQQRRD
ncbi:MAG: succinylglutamate desuccinylase/aspartoacylase family protein, partial [Planctomycetota bacterium]|nr:succinylglutamate desuccinylase/aspartoacylase family protein [Planctomycetota bacterium]